MPRRPHQAAYWEVDLVFDPSLRDQLRRWCRDNVAAKPLGLSWMAPRRPSEDDEFRIRRGDPGVVETWRFASHDDAVFFEMVWKEIA